ncbi:MAG: acyltransferase [Actinomycetota bacterium]|nr:acyltransferase [Actinomycetota bacterium]MDQ2955805.1 acyltransferase [Actinomycetota bacterium]
MASSLRQCLRPANNSLNALRLALALTVIVSHSWPLGGFGKEPLFGGETPGGWAVFGFFAISGYLIMGSRVSNGFAEYLQRRLRRIFPAFIVCLILTAFVFAPIGYWRAHHHLHGFATTPISPINYVLSNITLRMNNYNVAGGPTGLPYPRAWDGALWTLYYEFACYLIIGLCCCWTRFRSSALPIAILLLICTIARFEAVQVGKYAQNSDLSWVLHLAPFFLAGSLLYQLRDKVPMRVGLAGLSLVLLVAIPLLGTPRLVVFCALPMAYLCMWLGARLPLQRVGRRNDVSYGVYIYGFPVQQLLALYGQHRHGQLTYIVLAVLCTLPLAAASWFLVERPAMGSRRRVRTDPPRHRASPEPHTELVAAR